MTKRSKEAADIFLFLPLSFAESRCGAGGDAHAPLFPGWPSRFRPMRQLDDVPCVLPLPTSRVRHAGRYNRISFFASRSSYDVSPDTTIPGLMIDQPIV